MRIIAMTFAAAFALVAFAAVAEAASPKWGVRRSQIADPQPQPEPYSCTSSYCVCKGPKTGEDCAKLVKDTACTAEKLVCDYRGCICARN